MCFPKKILKPCKYLANNSFLSPKSNNFAAANRSILAFWRGARVVDEARLESVYPAKPVRRFESCSLR